MKKILADIHRKAALLIKRSEESQVFRVNFHHLEDDWYIYCRIISGEKIYGIAQIPAGDEEMLYLKNAYVDSLVGRKREFVAKVEKAFIQLWNELEEMKQETEK